MSIFKISDRLTGPAAIATTILYLAACVVYFLPIGIPHKITLTTGLLALTSFWLCPWQITLALLFSALGDYMGSCGNFLGQMGCFGLVHIFFILYFIDRYSHKIELHGKMSGKFKGYLTMVLLCTAALLGIAFGRLAPCAPAGILRTGIIVYSLLISAMMVTALIQRSSLFALGAVLFVFSDFILAWNRFVEPVPYHTYMILGPYFTAQWLLFIRTTSFRVAPEMRILRF